MPCINLPLNCSRSACGFDINMHPTTFYKAPLLSSNPLTMSSFKIKKFSFSNQCQQKLSMVMEHLIRIFISRREFRALLSRHFSHFDEKLSNNKTCPKGKGIFISASRTSERQFSPSFPFAIDTSDTCSTAPFYGVLA